jgi:5-methylcytosine-specific restriction protein A
MPPRAKRPCTTPRCPNYAIDTKYCEEHQERVVQADRARGTAHERGYTSKWQRYSRAFLKRNPLCVCDECKKLPVPLPAQVTDHIIPHKGDSKLFWDKSNHQALNKRCHDRKTAKYDGGFGR